MNIKYNKDPFECFSEHLRRHSPWLRNDCDSNGIPTDCHCVLCESVNKIIISTSLVAMQGPSPAALCPQCLINNIPDLVCRHCNAGADREQAVSQPTSPDSHSTTPPDSQGDPQSASEDSNTQNKETSQTNQQEGFMPDDESDDDDGWARWPHGLHHSRLVNYSPATTPPWPTVPLQNWQVGRARRDERRSRQPLSRARHSAAAAAAAAQGTADGRLQRGTDSPTTSTLNRPRRVPPARREEAPMTTDRSIEVEVLKVTTGRSPASDGTYILGDCPICLEYLGIRQVAATICGHCYCHSCIKRHLKKNLLCPSCRRLLHGNHIIPLYLQQKCKAPPRSTHE